MIRPIEERGEQLAVAAGRRAPVMQLGDHPDEPYGDDDERVGYGEDDYDWER